MSFRVHARNRWCLALFHEESTFEIKSASEKLTRYPVFFGGVSRMRFIVGLLALFHQ